MGGQRYLPEPTASCPSFDSDSEWQPFVDGAHYLPELDANLTDLGAGDRVIIAGFEFDTRLDLQGRQRDDPDYLSLGEKLAGLAANGVDVRIVLAGERVAAVLPIPALAGFRRNVHAARQLRRWRPDGASDTPLRGRIFLDKSGPFVGSNHLKSVAILRSGVVTAFVGGIDLTLDRFDAGPHDTLRMRGRRWGWHDAAVRLRGPAAARVHDTLADRWRAAARAHSRSRLGRAVVERAPIPPAPAQPSVPTPGTEVRVVRSIPRRPTLLGLRRVPPVHEVFETLTSAFAAAERYIYIEDQYLCEQAGGHRDFELYPYLRAAALRGVKIALVGSGVRDNDDPGLHVSQINRTINRDIQRKVIDRLDPDRRANVSVHRVRRVTVHAKIVLVDDRFGCIGSANMFSRSMSGTDRELSSAIVTSTHVVRDVRVQLWAEHLRTPFTPELLPALENLDTALGIFDPRWSTEPTWWQEAGAPAGFAPTERALLRVPERRGRMHALREVSQES